MIEGKFGENLMIEIFKEWWFFLHNPPVYSSFWDDLTEGMEALTWRSPWNMMRSAVFAVDFVGYYSGWTVPEVYGLFCDEERYYDHLDSREIE